MGKVLGNLGEMVGDVEKSTEKPKVSKPWVAESKAKPVVAINGWGKEFYFPSGREAARKLGLRQSGIAYCLSGQRKKTGGYRFRYADN